MRLYKDIKPEHTDSRGRIVKVLSNAVMRGIQSVIMIDSKKGAVRGNHYHLKEAHYMYVLRGRMTYYEQGLGKNAVRKEASLSEGDMVYTEPNVIHAVVSDEDSSLMYFSTEPRNQASYRKDTKYVKII